MEKEIKKTESGYYENKIADWFLRLQLICILALSGGGIAQEISAEQQQDQHNPKAGIEQTVSFSPAFKSPQPLDIFSNPEDLFDYCNLSEDAKDPIDRAKANGGIVFESVLEGDREELFSMIINKQDIISENEEADPEKLQILLVPIGYSTEEIDSKIKTSLPYLDYAFRDVNVDFSYLGKSAPIGISRFDRLGIVSDEFEVSVLDKKIQVNYPVDKYIFVFKSNEHIAATGKHAVVSGNAGTQAYTLPHETGHLLGLDDGYQRYYGVNDISSTDLFTSTEFLRTDVDIAYNQVGRPKPVLIEDGECGEWPVYTFYDPKDNVMQVYSPADKAMLSGKELFNPLQINIMNANVRKILLTKRP